MNQPQTSPTELYIFNHEPAGSLVLRCAHYRVPFHQEQGTVVILQGYGEKIEAYHETILRLAEKNLSSVTFDWLGQGGSYDKNIPYSRAEQMNVKTDLTHLQQFLRDIVYPDFKPPFFLLAHDMGALLTLAAQDIIGNQFERILLTSPSFSPFGHQVNGFYHKFCQCVSALQLGRLFKARMGKKYRIHPVRDLGARPKSISETAEYDSFEPTINTATTLLNLSRHCLYSSSAVHVPCLIVQAGQNRSRTDAIQYFLQRIRLLDALTIMGSDKDILFEDERYRTQFWAAFDAFIPGSKAPENALRPI